MYAADGKTFAYMCKSLIREIVDLLAYLFFNEVSNYLLSSSVVREGEIDLFIEKFLAFLERSVVGLVSACNDCNPIILSPEFILLKISKDLLHLGAKRCSPIFLLLLHSTKDSLKVVDHDDCRLVLLGTNDDRPQKFGQL